MVDAIKKLETELVKGQHSETELLTNIYTSLQGLGIGLRKVEKQIQIKGKINKPLKFITYKSSKCDL